MKPYRWNAEKDKKLQSERGLGFEGAVKRLESDGFLGAFDHPNQEKYPHQRVFIFEYEGYIWLMPFVEDSHSIFLKTFYRSRKQLKKYKDKSHEKDET